MEPRKVQTLNVQERFRYIRGLMVQAGVSNAQIARDEDVSVTYVHYVLTQQRPGYRIRRAIAAACGVFVEDLWPDTPPEYRRAA
jgi:lambda repressor-like predicted transcriptional regulator